MAKKSILQEGYKFQIDMGIFNVKYIPYLETIHRYEVFWGGSSSGKSNFIAHKLALQLTMMDGRNLICLRKKGNDARDSVYPEIESALFEMDLLQLWDVVEHPMPRLVNKNNGNVIAFSGLDDAEDVKSIKFKKGRFLTDIWYEEATGEDDMDNLRELDRRLRGRGKKKRIIFSFNPVYVLHPIKDYLWKELAENGADIVFCHSTYKDNAFLDPEDVRTIERFQKTDPYSWMVYGLGLWGTTGLTVFNMNKVNDRLKWLKDHEEDTGFYKVAVSYEKDPNGTVLSSTFQTYRYSDGESTIFKPPVPGRPYAAAFDTANGGADYWALQICDNITGEQVATYHSTNMPNVCIYQILGLLIYYNNAVVAPEINFGAYSLEKLLEMKYYHIYRRDAHPDRMDMQVEPKYGFLTTEENRSMILSKLVEWTEENMHLINDKETLLEMLSFTRQKAKRGSTVRWAAEPGAHDDLIMALAILLMVRPQQRTYVKEELKKLEGFWFPEELDFVVDSGSMKEMEADEYKRKMLSSIGVGASTPMNGGIIPW